MRLWVAAALVLAVIPPAAAQNWLGFSREQTEQAFAPPTSPEPARPDPAMTPGDVDPHVTLADICTGTTKTRRHVSPATRAKVLRDYNVSDAASVGMEMDHLVPLAIGGANTAKNLWPQESPDYERKDRLEVELQRRVCRAYETLAPAEAEVVLHQEQREIAEDWVAAERRYVGTTGAAR